MHHILFYIYVFKHLQLHLKISINEGKISPREREIDFYIFLTNIDNNNIYNYLQLALSESRAK